MKKKLIIAAAIAFAVFAVLRQQCTVYRICSK